LLFYIVVWDISLSLLILLLFFLRVCLTVHHQYSDTICKYNGWCYKINIISLLIVEVRDPLLYLFIIVKIFQYFKQLWKNTHHKIRRPNW